MRLIDADELEGKISNSITWVDNNLVADRFAEGCKASLRDLLSTIKNYMEIIEAEPVRHGYWTDINGDNSLYECSICGNQCCCRSNYCNDCGAKMEVNNK